MDTNAPRLNVLLVDDQRANLIVLQEILKNLPVNLLLPARRPEDGTGS
jgi:hypothetical protein